ncbi:MAG: hypothetical protein LBQ43_00120 [Holosporales bacterium]|nr:hypothetical protein [Holosporales bacterium]
MEKRSLLFASVACFGGCFSCNADKSDVRFFLEDNQVMFQNLAEDKSFFHSVLTLCSEVFSSQEDVSGVKRVCLGFRRSRLGTPFEQGMALNTLLGCFCRDLSCACESYRDLSAREFLGVLPMDVITHILPEDARAVVPLLHLCPSSCLSWVGDILLKLLEASPLDKRYLLDGVGDFCKLIDDSEAVLFMGRAYPYLANSIHIAAFAWCLCFNRENNVVACVNSNLLSAVASDLGEDQVSSIISSLAEDADSQVGHNVIRSIVDHIVSGGDEALSVLNNCPGFINSLVRNANRALKSGHFNMMQLLSLFCQKSVPLRRCFLKIITEDINNVDAFLVALNRSELVRFFSWLAESTANGDTQAAILVNHIRDTNAPVFMGIVAMMVNCGYQQGVEVMNTFDFHAVQLFANTIYDLAEEGVVCLNTVSDLGRACKNESPELFDLFSEWFSTFKENSFISLFESLGVPELLPNLDVDEVLAGAIHDCTATPAVGALIECSLYPGDVVLAALTTARETGDTSWIFDFLTKISYPQWGRLEFSPEDFLAVRELFVTLCNAEFDFIRSGSDLDDICSTFNVDESFLAFIQGRSAAGYQNSTMTAHGMYLLATLDAYEDKAGAKSEAVDALIAAVTCGDVSALPLLLKINGEGADVHQDVFTRVETFFSSLDFFKALNIIDLSTLVRCARKYINKPDIFEVLTRAALGGVNVCDGFARFIKMCNREEVLEVVAFLNELVSHMRIDEYGVLLNTTILRLAVHQDQRFFPPEFLNNAAIYLISCIAYNVPVPYINFSHIINDDTPWVCLLRDILAS